MLIRDIDTLKQTVKVGKSAPWSAFEPYVADAERFYLEYYLGRPLMERLSGELAGEPDLALLLKEVQRVLGPLVYMLATHEGSILFGDAGHTVVRTTTAAPASDVKVEKAYESAQYRGWQNMEVLLSFLEENAGRYPEWRHSRYCQAPQSMFFRSAEMFQSDGMIDICNSRLTFEKLLPLIRRVEVTEITDLVTSEVCAGLGESVLSNIETQLVACIRPYIATRVAVLHTSKNTRMQRSEYSRPEFKPLIRSLYEDPEDSTNYYAQQLAYWRGKIFGLLGEMGIDQPGALKFNTPDSRVFCDIG